MWPFSSKKDYEADLVALQKQISDARSKAASRRALKSKVAFTRTLHAFVVWLAFSLCVWKNVIIESGHPRALIGGSLGSLLVLRRVLLAVLDRRVVSQEAAVKRLTAKRDELVKEYKKQTNYEEIKRVLDEAKGDTETGAANPQEKQQHQQHQQHHKRLEQQHQQQQADAQQVYGQPGQLLLENSDHNMASALIKPQDMMQYPTHPTWLDRIAEAVLGVNEYSPANCYALICPHCHSHNGLAPYGENAADVTYRCYSCGFLNGPDTNADIRALESSDSKQIADSEKAERDSEEAEQLADSGNEAETLEAAAGSPDNDERSLGNQSEVEYLSESPEPLSESPSPEPNSQSDSKPNSRKGRASVASFKCR